VTTLEDSGALDDVEVAAALGTLDLLDALPLISWFVCADDLTDVMDTMAPGAIWRSAPRIQNVGKIRKTLHRAR
jgi:hypothetical protein